MRQLHGFRVTSCSRTPTAYPISRNRFRLLTMTARIGMLPMEPGSLVMERKMLLGTKQRAERLASERGEAARPTAVP